MEIMTENAQNYTLTKVSLRCGRNMNFEVGYAGDGCGWCEDNTSNQTQATCC